MAHHLHLISSQSVRVVHAVLRRPKLKVQVLVGAPILSNSPVVQTVERPPLKRKVDGASPSAIAHENYRGALSAKPQERPSHPGPSFLIIMEAKADQRAASGWKPAGPRLCVGCGACPLASAI